MQFVSLTTKERVSSVHKLKDLKPENSVDFKADETRMLDVCKLKRTKKVLQFSGFRHQACCSLYTEDRESYGKRNYGISGGF